jgi:hypothetical protein
MSPEMVLARIRAGEQEALDSELEITLPEMPGQPQR